MQGVTVDTRITVDPCVVTQSSYIHNQGIAIPSADRMAERLWWIRVLHRRPSVCRDDAEKVVPFVEDHHLTGRLDELEGEESGGGESDNSCRQTAGSGIVHSLPCRKFRMFLLGPG